MQKLRAYFLRFCSLAVCFVLCLLPLNAYAGETFDLYTYEPVDTATGQWTYDYYLNEVTSTFSHVAELAHETVLASSVGINPAKYQFTPLSDSKVMNGTNLFHDVIMLHRADNASLFVAGESFIIDIGKVSFELDGRSTSTLKRRSNLDITKIKRFTVSLVSGDGELAEIINCTGDDIGELMVYTDGVTEGTNANKYDIHFESKNVPFDVYQVNIEIYTGKEAYNNNNIAPDDYTGTSWNLSGRGDRYYGVRGKLTCEVEPASNDGLIAGIVEWIQKIYNSIVSLPANIWNFIKNGLLDLFVPDAEFMEGYKAEWDSVLQDSMGGVYQSVSMIDDFYKTFQNAGSQSTITFPKVNVPVAGEVFEFGGYEVDIVPDEAPFLQTVINGIKLITNAMCTLAVLQAFKRRYERVVSE